MGGSVVVVVPGAVVVVVPGAVVVVVPGAVVVVVVGATVVVVGATVVVVVGATVVVVAPITVTESITFVGPTLSTHGDGSWVSSTVPRPAPEVDLQEVVDPRVDLDRCRALAGDGRRQGVVGISVHLAELHGAGRDRRPHRVTGHIGSRARAELGSALCPESGIGTDRLPTSSVPVRVSSGAVWFGVPFVTDV